MSFLIKVSPKLLSNKKAGNAVITAALVVSTWQTEDALEVNGSSVGDRISQLPMTRTYSQSSTHFMSQPHAENTYKEVFSSVLAQHTSIHRAGEGSGDQGEMDLKVWPERCSVHMGDPPTQVTSHPQPGRKAA